MLSSSSSSSTTTISNLTTPSLILNKHAFTKNCRIILEEARRKNMRLRPHVKTHKTLEGAFLQATGGMDQCWPEVTGFVASTIPEISMLINASSKYNGYPFNDILYGVPVSESKLQKIQTLLTKLKEKGVRGGKIHLMVDHASQIDFLEAFVSSSDKTDILSVFLKIDTGYHRAGVPFDDVESANLAMRIIESSCLEMKGIYSHCGHAYDINDATEMKEIAQTDYSKMMHFTKLLKDHFFAASNENKHCEFPSLDISVGSTPSVFSHANELNLPTLEIHPGNYTLYDRQQQWTGACQSESDIAVRIISRVIGHYEDRNTIMLDAGATALTKESTPQGSVCSIAEHEKDLDCFKMSQEMILVRPKDEKKVFPFEDFPLGKVVNLIPNHSCLAAACFETYHVIDDLGCSFGENEKVIDTWTPAKGW